MAYCPTQTLSDIAVECGSNRGGVMVVAVRNRADIATLTESDGVVSAITLDAGAAADATVLSFRAQTCQLSTEATIDDAAGTHFYTSTLAFRFAKMDATKRLSINALVHAETIAIVKDANGVYWLVGDEEPLRAAAVTGTTGTAHSDANEYTPSLSAYSSEMPKIIETAAITTFLGGATL